MANGRRNNREPNENLYKVSRVSAHLIGAIQFSYSVYYDWNYVKIPKEASSMGSGFGGKLKFLTFWDACVQAIYFTICLINDYYGTNESNPSRTPLIRKIKDYMLCSIAFPLAMFVGLTFWGLYAVDRELVFPKALDPYFPTWLNHVMHTNIMVFTILEILICFRKYPTRKEGLGGLTIFMLIYLVWTHVIYFKTGAWVYPILEVLNWGQRVIFFVGLLLFVNSLYFVGEYFNKLVWAKELKQVQSGTNGRRKKQ